MTDDDDRLPSPADENRRPRSQEDATPSPVPPSDAAADRRVAAPLDVQSYIGRQLRAVYDDVVRQPIPDRFLSLMKQLEEQSSAK